MTDQNTFILPFTEIRATDLPLVGGKGANLGEMTKAGFPVPGGFVVTTYAYREYLQHNQLADWVLVQSAKGKGASPEELAAISTEIRTRFAAGEVPKNVLALLKAAYQETSDTPVAVRSSATTEDLPEMSFAGQQDTFLNIVGESAFLEAVVACWSSLWTARAIGYRFRNQIPQQSAALAVVVQDMVLAESSGVMFTANPLTGKRSETVIDAVWGLGEALVKGQVEPDHYIVDLAKKQIISSQQGKKAVVIRSKDGGGVEMLQRAHDDTPALHETQIFALAEEGQKIAALYNFPQDIEWAFVGNELFILQSRPVTSLFPVPENLPDDHLMAFFSFASVQGYMGPITPLGMDALRLIFAGLGTLLGYDYSYQEQKVLYKAGERLWVNITGFMRHPLGAKILPKVFSMIDPGLVTSLEKIYQSPEAEAGQGKLRLKSFGRVTKFILPIWARAARNLLAPKGQLDVAQNTLTSYLDEVREKANSGSPTELFRMIYFGFIRIVGIFIPAIMAGYLPLIILTRITKRLTGNGELALEITRGLPHNVTTEMNLFLWQTASRLSSEPQVRAQMLETPAEELAADYLKNALPPLAQDAIAQFLQRYGMRGVGEIDFGQPRWRDTPTQIMQTLQTYLKIDDPKLAPDTVFKRGEESASAAVAKLQALARKTFGGRIKAWIIGGLVHRLRSFAGLRESPKFNIVRAFGIIRTEIQAYGKTLAERGVLDDPDDIFFLTLAELESISDTTEDSLQPVIAERKENQNREKLRRQLPRLLFSDGCAFYEGLGGNVDADTALVGAPVSPGVAEGRVRVVVDPQNANLQPGEILVCTGTDPAWTPLFLAAGGLVMEVGGMMTHGAIVAREYGIPAVVGVTQAPTRFTTGQRIRVDGSSGIIEVL
ncbi:MAG: PEP/pyruvate-binding domain-containing protein [Gammaproteobacteria bacterium]